MKIGEIRMEVPSVDSELMLGNRTAKECEVVFIHPEWRFYVVEFKTDLGWSFREAFYFRDRDPKGPPLPKHIAEQRRAGGKVHSRPRHLSKPRIEVWANPLYT